MEKRLISILFAVCAVFSLTCCAKKPADTDSARVPADMSEYATYDAEVEYVFDVSSAVNVLERMDNKESFVAYFGYAECPFCNPAMPVLNEVATDMHSRVDYIDVRSNDAWKSNTDIDGYDLLVDRIGYLFEADEDGPHMYVPFVMFVKDGEVVLDHTGVTSDFEVGNDITPEQRDELADIYKQGFSEIR